MENNKQKCPVCGVIKVQTNKGFMFETEASRTMGCSLMTPAAFNTKCCRHTKNTGCINNNNGYDARYDHTRTDVLDDMIDQKVLELRKDIINHKED